MLRINAAGVPIGGGGIRGRARMLGMTSRLYSANHSFAEPSGQLWQDFPISIAGDGGAHLRRHA